MLNCVSDIGDRLLNAPPRVSPARLQRRRLATDVSLAFVLAVVFIAVAGGLGVVAWFGILVLLIGLLTVAVERGVRRRRGSRRRAR